MPGERTFYLQIKSGAEIVSLSLEKSQVAALGERLRYMLKEIRLVHPMSHRPQLYRDSLPLDLPLQEEFRVGSIAIFYNEDDSLIQVDLREMNSGEIEFGEDEDDDDSPFQLDSQLIRLFISAEQARTFYDRAELVVGAGRQPCPFCGFPIDPQGHLCARANGYRR